MRRLRTAAAALIVSLLVTGGAVAAKPEQPPGQAKKSGTVDIQLITISDWHGQLPPLDVFGVGLIGGAPALATYLKQEREANPNTLTFMAGDSIGATPPVSSFFEDEPAIQAMNMMGITADTFGNHNFDRGVDHLQRMIDLAEFDFVVSNLRNVEENLSGTEKMQIYNVAGVKVAVIGIVNEEAPELVTPGSLGTIEITDSIEAANKMARVARRAADIVVVLTHKGIRGFDSGGNAFGELVDFANGVDADLIDVIVGDHTDFQYGAVHQDRIQVVENRSKGRSYARISLEFDRAEGLQDASVEFVTPFTNDVEPDPELQAFLDDLNAQLAPILGTVIGSADVAITQRDSCGNAAGRTCESLVGNAVSDALRATYGTDFAITNSGGLRTNLTCPADDNPTDFCPAFTPPPFPITRGQVLAVLPFGNVSTTSVLTGDEIKAWLENGVSRTGAQGRFPQVSGLCFTYDIARPAGDRVLGIVRQAEDGTCAGDAVMSGESYSLTTNDFMAAGGDGYPNILGNPATTTRNIMDADVADFVAANSPLSPSIQGRITCVDGDGPGVGNDCPTPIGP